MKSIYFISIMFLLASCGHSNRFSIKGTFRNSQHQMIWLKELALNDVLVVDSTKTDENGDFKLKGRITKPGFYTLATDDKNNYITLILNPGDHLKIEADAKDLEKTYRIEGSKDAELVRELTSKLDSTRDKISDLGKIFNDSIHSPNIMKFKDHLDSIYNSLLKDEHQFSENFIRNNIQSMASLMALYQQVAPRVNVLSPKEDYALFKMVDSSLVQLYPEADAVKSLHSLMNDINEQNLESQAVEKRTSKGEIAPEIALPDPKGDTIRLSSMRGKYVLLDFWASWCKPCREENPNLVKNYWKYKNRGFEIFQVSLDKTKDAWLKGITDDKLNWIHVSDLKYWNSSVVPLYGIEGIPYNLLLDPSGKIIDKNLQGEHLSSKLKEIFKY